MVEFRSSRWLQVKIAICNNFLEKILVLFNAIGNSCCARICVFCDAVSDNEQDNASQITVLRGTEAALNPSMTNHFC